MGWSWVLDRRENGRESSRMGRLELSTISDRSTGLRCICAGVNRSLLMVVFSLEGGYHEPSVCQITFADLLRGSGDSSTCIVLSSPYSAMMGSKSYLTNLFLCPT